jgi:hypothetical protein
MEYPNMNGNGINVGGFTFIFTRLSWSIEILSLRCIIPVASKSRHQIFYSSPQLISRACRRATRYDGDCNSGDLRYTKIPQYQPDKQAIRRSILFQLGWFVIKRNEQSWFEICSSKKKIYRCLQVCLLCLSLRKIIWPRGFTFWKTYIAGMDGVLLGSWS